MESLIAQARWVIQIGSVLGLLGVGIGAFGAHSLRAKLEAAGRMDTFETAVRYQFYHALALVLVGIITQLLANNPAALKTLNWSAYSFVAGTLIFSGSLYVLCLLGINWLGAITPIGGLFFLAGWGLLFWSVGK
ncbi:DUF423 domain-containing protein [Fibrivirga algicola]|uniref:DUF423 domain-containing protein n=1 Tax=Fibrivirga algicola TaxID=2950420 RepID=A0ABX0QJT7_9BACT|nr:DUF423 domain-containing protein [Fibrivirga algicola]ARK11591.1 hypothetical protein A6C57_15340 [Fibrella sp. ES10-3-2-2]NID12544.1 DUF423 domain-containing protein [Fibrivirga algicola]